MTLCGQRGVLEGSHEIRELLMLPVSSYMVHTANTKNKGCCKCTRSEGDRRTTVDIIMHVDSLASFIANGIKSHRPALVVSYPLPTIPTPSLCKPGPALQNQSGVPTALQTVNSASVSRRGGLSTFKAYAKLARIQGGSLCYHHCSIMT